jgi:hypothetical protein
MVQILPAVDRGPSKSENFTQAIRGLTQLGSAYMANQRRENATEAENQAFRSKGINLQGIGDPEMRKLIVSEELKSKAEQKKFSEQIKANEPKIRAIERQYGLEEGELQSFVNDPSLAARVARPKAKTQASQPIDPDQMAKINAIIAKPEFDELSPTQQNLELLKGGVSKENARSVVEPKIEELKLGEKKATRQESGIERSYASQKEFINDTTNSYKGFETEMKPRLLQMRNIPDEDIVGPTSAVFLEHLGIPLGALENPASELYNKLSQDLLKGLPETYGSRILKVEVDNFLKTIPTLMNSPDGRRMIASNMLKLGEMKEVYYNAMRREQEKIETNKEQYPRDFQQKVFDQVKPQIDRINDEFVKLSEVTSVPKDHIPFFAPDGEIKFVPKEHAQWAQEQGAKRIW